VGAASHIAGETAITHRRVLAIAVPIMLSNVSTPLLGAVDTAIVGRLPDPAYIGAVALGALVFSFVFWAFGFLRMGTTGLTAQALGAGDADELRAALGRSLILGVGIGAALVALQWPIGQAAFALLEGGQQVEALARQYYDVRIWAAPATLVNYSLLVWFIGLGRAKIALLLQLVLNVTNMALDALFVLMLGLGVAGVAWGTLIAECVAAVLGLAIAARQLRRFGGRWQRSRVLERVALARTLAVNRDILIRSAALIVVFTWFVSNGARQGEVVLAANAVLMHFITVSAYFLDGIAFAAEALVGRAIGARDRAALLRTIRLTTVWAAAVAALASALLLVSGPWLVELFTVDMPTRESARLYLPWAALAPLAGVWAFQLDGIFIGATRTREMRDAMLLSLAIFLAGWWLLQDLGNHGLWAALYVHYAARTGTLLRFLPRLVHLSAA